MKQQPSERLAQARLAAGYERAADAARARGWSEATYHGHENGSRGITAEAALKYAQAFGITPSWLLWGAGADSTPAIRADEPDADGHISVAVYDVQVSAGHGSVVEHEEIIDHLRFPPNYLRHLTSTHPRHLVIVRVKGDSMSPTLNDDDVVLLDRSKINLGYDGLFVVEMDGALHVKRIERGDREGVVKVVSDNSRYQPIMRPVGELRAVGKVLWTGRKE